MSKRPSGAADAICTLLVGGFILIALVPKEVWIALGIGAVVIVGMWAITKGINASEQRRTEALERARVEQAAQAAAAKREREQRVQKEKQDRIDTMGKQNASLVESALSAVQQVTSSEAARAGWLGDIDFKPDIAWITRTFTKAHSLRGVTATLSVLNKPSADDRRILAEAKSAIAGLEDAAKERVGLISRCAVEAKNIDDSLRTEREDAKVAEQRAELHAKLSAMLYGIEAAPDQTPTNSAVEAVIARVQAYREIKRQIEIARAGG